MDGGIEKLRWAGRLIEERTKGRQRLLAGWDGMPVVGIEDGCMVGLYFALLKNRKTGLYDCHVKGYVRTCGGYRPGARMRDLAEECGLVASLVSELEGADIHVDEDTVKAFCGELKEKAVSNDI